MHLAPGAEWPRSEELLTLDCILSSRTEKCGLGLRSSSYAMSSEIEMQRLGVKSSTKFNTFEHHSHSRTGSNGSFRGGVSTSRSSRKHLEVRFLPRRRPSILEVGDDTLRLTRCATLEKFWVPLNPLSIRHIALLMGIHC